MEFIIVLILLLLWFFVAERVVRKILKVEKGSLEGTPGAKINAWSQGITIFLSLLIIPFAAEDWWEGMMFFWLVYLTSFSFVEAFLQWKYIPETREHLATLVMYPLGLGMLLGIGLLLF
ncbi:DUF4181 domain-containing protein [Planococcus chinensis]|uniref:DUF4181 domain-containing protein n=1 Tax=Planococcus chinensis TaxID=272917 RepID=A0ABW4QD46_9BACL